MEKILNDFNCCQKTFSSVADLLDLDEETILKIASGFGGGLQHGEVCGCVSGALMAIGLKLGSDDPTDEVARNLVSQTFEKYISDFRAKFGCAAVAAEGGQKGNAVPSGESAPQGRKGKSVKQLAFASKSKTPIVMLRMTLPPEGEACVVSHAPHEFPLRGKHVTPTNSNLSYQYHTNTLYYTYLIISICF